MLRLNRVRRRQLNIASAICGILILGWIVRNTYTIRTFFSYVTRPAWDTLIYPTDPIINLATPQLFDIHDSTYICALHRNSSPRQGDVRLWDGIMFSHELDMLEIHLAELYDEVDLFVIQESTVTYTGIPKALHFKENRKRFRRFEDKIHHVIFDPYPGEGSVPVQKPGEWGIETTQRNHMTETINELYNAQPNIETLVLVADTDEIPYASTMRLVKTCALPPTLHFQLIPYVYSFEWVSGDLDSWHIQLHTWDPSTSYYKHHSKSTEDYITMAGTHCSFCFPTIADFQFKMRAYSHNDRLGDHPKALLRPERIQRAICEGDNIFGMLPEAYTWWDLITRWRGHQAQRLTAVSEGLGFARKAIPEVLPACIEIDLQG